MCSFLSLLLETLRHSCRHKYICFFEPESHRTKFPSYDMLTEDTPYLENSIPVKIAQLMNLNHLFQTRMNYVSTYYPDSVNYEICYHIFNISTLKNSHFSASDLLIIR